MLSFMLIYFKISYIFLDCKVYQVDFDLYYATGCICHVVCIMLGLPVVLPMLCLHDIKTCMLDTTPVLQWTNADWLYLLYSFKMLQTSIDYLP